MYTGQAAAGFEDGLRDLRAHVRRHDYGTVRRDALPFPDLLIKAADGEFTCRVGGGTGGGYVDQRGEAVEHFERLGLIIGDFCWNDRDVERGGIQGERAS